MKVNTQFSTMNVFHHFHKPSASLDICLAVFDYYSFLLSLIKLMNTFSFNGKFVHGLHNIQIIMFKR